MWAYKSADFVRSRQIYTILHSLHVVCSAEQECHLRSAEVDNTYHLDSANGVLHTKGSYTIYSFRRPCSIGTELTSIGQCRHAQSIFTWTDDTVTSQIGKNVPKGCYRRFVGGSYSWYFNKHQTGADTAVYETDEYICRTTPRSSPRRCGLCVTQLALFPSLFANRLFNALLFC